MTTLPWMIRGPSTAEFSYDALKISEVKALGVYTCGNPTDPEIVRYMFSLDVKSIVLLDGQLEIKDVNVGVSAKVRQRSLTLSNPH